MFFDTTRNWFRLLFNREGTWMNANSNRLFPRTSPRCNGIRIAFRGLYMARRRRNDDWAGPLAQLVGLAVLACAFIPGVREMVVALGVIALTVIGIVVVGLVAFVIYRLVGPGRPMQPVSGQGFAHPCRISDQQRTPAAALKSPVKTLVAPEIPKQLRSMDWFQFEKLVGHVYRKLGYTVIRRGGANPDGGIDLIIEKAGQRAAVQCKQWQTRDVGVQVVREFLGALTDVRIPTGILITLRGYTGDAKQLAEKHHIEIVNEAGLTRMLESTDAKFDPAVLELLRDTRKFCPRCEAELMIRIAKKGPNSGGKFWGCSTYPRCCFTLSIA